MNLVIWTEKYRKPIEDVRYFPEFLTLAIMDENNKRGSNEIRIRCSRDKCNDAGIIEAFKGLISQLRVYPGSNIYLPSKEDMDIIQFVINNCGVDIDYKDIFVLNSSEYYNIHRDSVATNANSRKSRLSKFIDLYRAKKFDNMTIGDRMKEKELADQKSKKYVAHSETGKYHMHDCPYVRKIKGANLIYLDEHELSDRFTPCSKCIPIVEEEYNEPYLDVDTNETVKSESWDPDDYLEPEDYAEYEQDSGEEEYDEQDLEEEEYDEPESTEEPEDIEEPESTEEPEDTEEPESTSKTLMDEPKGIKHEQIINSDDIISPLGRQIVKICDKFDLYCTIYGKNIQILTVAGAWKFDYTHRPIELYHQNYATRGASKRNIEYHKQAGDYYSPVDAIAYIIKHDNNRVKNMLKDLK